jgi:hypothetical protein
MKTLKTNLYSYAELSTEAKDKAYETWRENRQESYPELLEHYQNEILDSLQGLAKCLGGVLVDYCFGAFAQGQARGRYKGYGEELTGNRALAYATKQLIRAGYPRQKTFAEFRDKSFTGLCKFTGVCYDDDFAQILITELINSTGENLSRIFDYICLHACTMLEQEYKYVTSKEYFVDTVADEPLFLGSGIAFPCPGLIIF